MNNKPVAWMELHYGEPNNLSWTDAELRDSGEVYKTIPLYTHPVKEDAQYDRGFDDGCKHTKKIYEVEIEALKAHLVKELTETDLILILEVLIDSYDDTNRGFLEYEAMYKNSPMHKARIDGMKRMVDKHTHAIEMVEAILRKAQEL